MTTIYDQTDKNLGNIVSEGMFGLNALTTVAATTDALMQERFRDLGISNLRFPGGSVTEEYFDISDISSGSMDKLSGTFRGTEKTLIPFTDFIDLAGELDVSVTLVIPTMTGFSQTAAQALSAGTYGQRLVSAAYLEDVQEFVVAAIEIAQAQGVEVAALEIGNEFWGSGEMTAAEYGKLAAAVSQVITNTLSAIGIPPIERPDIVVQTISSAGVMSPSRDMRVFLDGETDVIYHASDLEKMDQEQIGRLTEVQMASQGNARHQALSIISAFEQQEILVISDEGAISDFDISGAANAIDAVVDHYYVGGGFEVVNTGEQYGFNQLELWNIALDARDAAAGDLDYYITEWNTLRHAATELANNRGLQQVSMNIEIFYEMVTHGVTSANFWPVIFNHSNSGTLVFHSAEALTIAGEGFALMSEALTGLKPMLDFTTAGDFSVHGYGDENRLVYLFSERSGNENALVLNLMESISIDADYYRVSWVELWDGGAGGVDEMAAPILSKTTVVDLVAAEDLEEFLVTLQAWSVLRMEIEGVNQAEVGGALKYRAGPQARHIEGSAVADRLRGGLGNDTLLGEAGDDTLNGFEGDDLVSGKVGNDRIKGGWGDDTLHGNDGNDRLVGDWGNDVLFGGDGVDTMIGGLEADIFVIDASAGSRDIILDFIMGEDRIDVSRWDLDGVPDINISWVNGQTFVQDQAERFFVIENLTQTEAASLSMDDFILDSGQDPFGAVETNQSQSALSPSAASLPSLVELPEVDPVLLLGGAGDDLLEGGAVKDTLVGNAGDDTLLGGAGSDRLAGGDGNDLIEGGAGDDNLGGGHGADRLEGQAGDDTLGGGAGDDTLFGGDGTDVLSGGAGNDLLEGGAGNDRLAGSFGHDTVRGGNGDDRIGGGPGRDLLEGGDGNDALGGGEADDTVLGGSGDDFLAGGGRDDFLDGGTSNDTLNGGAGHDRLIGGEGADIFVFNDFTDGERDVIVDFQSGVDHIRLAGIEGQGAIGRFVSLDIRDTDAGALLRHSGHEILLEEVAASSLSHDDFNFL